MKQLKFVQYTNAQNNLEFNQVKLINSSDTVPPGMVWKVESVLANSHLPAPNVLYGTDYHTDVISILVNNNVIYISSSQVVNQQNENTKQLTKLPFWLPAGATLNIHTNYEYISIIEYLVTPN